MQSLNFWENSSVLSPSEYIQLYNENPDRIESVTMILPRIGIDNHFGKFKVVFSPVYAGFENHG